MNEDDEAASEESVREAVERSRSGAPAAGRAVRDRFSADEIFQRVVVAAHEEVSASTRELFFSGLAAGLAITLTFMLHASMTAQAGEGSGLIGVVLYPLGFVYIILGNYQLYTENTLPPVALVLERLASLPALFRIWGLVLFANAVGAIVGALVLANTGVLTPEAVEVAATFGTEGIETGWWTLFHKGVFAGFIVAGVVWIDYAARDTISRLVLVYLAFLAIPAGGLYHSVVSITDMFFLVFEGQLRVVPGLVEFVLPVLLGNTVGGVVLVTAVNYAQTSEHRLDIGIETDVSRLTPREWLLGSLVGRSYVTGDRETETPNRGD